MLFKVGTAPKGIPPSAAAKLAENKFKREIIYNRWLRLNEIPFASARPGDRVIVEVSEGESFELVLNMVNVHESSTSWFANFPGERGSALDVFFSRPQDSTRPPSLFVAGLRLPNRLFEITTVEDIPGWARLREVKPNSGTHLFIENDVAPASIDKNEDR